MNRRRILCLQSQSAEQETMLKNQFQAAAFPSRSHTRAVRCGQKISTRTTEQIRWAHLHIQQAQLTKEQRQSMQVLEVQHLNEKTRRMLGIR